MIQLNSLKIPKERYISPEKRQIIDEPDKELMTFDVWSYLSIDDINKEEKKHQYYYQIKPLKVQ